MFITDAPELEHHSKNPMLKALNTVQKRVRTYMVWSHAPRPFWGETALYTATTVYHMPSVANPGKAAPITLVYGRKPNFSKLHPFGCLAFIHVSKKDRNGALNKSIHFGMLLGYATASDGHIISYRVYNYSTNRFGYPADVTFNPDCSAIPYIASLPLAPAMRLREREHRNVERDVAKHTQLGYASLRKLHSLITWIATLQSSSIRPLLLKER